MTPRAASLALRLALLLLGALGALITPAFAATPAGTPAPAHAAPRASGIDLAAIDRSVAPGDDFFQYANGSWLKSTEIPPDRASYGTDEKLAELNAKRTAKLIREAARAPEGSEARKVGDYYTTFMDEAHIEALGLSPLAPALARIAAIGDRTQLAQALGAQLRSDVDVLNATNVHTPNLFGLWVAQDLDAPGQYSPFLLQGGLEMFDRDYYLNPSAHMAEIRGKYQAHIAAVLKLAGAADPQREAAQVFELEKRIAAVHVSRADTEDVLKGNNHWSRADFETRAPGLEWRAFFAAAGLGAQQRFVVWQPGAVTGISALVAAEPLETWKTYLRFHALEQAAFCLPKAYVAERFEFYGRVLSGTPKLRERWKRAVDATNLALGEAIGKLYVAQYFPAAEKARAEAMVRNLLAAFATRVDHIEWMAPETRRQAKAKLAALKVGVGYPDKWRDYSGLEVVRGDALGNAERAELFDYRLDLAKLGQPVDRSEWVMTPQTVNAVNLPAMNALNFPAAILQPPYFDPKRDPLLDYGAIGAVIGHEISHAFDDQGSKYDASGRLSNWWTEEDRKNFDARTAQLARQYDQYEPLPGLHLNGKLTLGENIADLAGLVIAHKAYEISLGGKPAPVLSGLSGNQRFYIAYGQSWRELWSDGLTRRVVLSNPHSPPKYRVDGVVRNDDGWYAAFPQVKASDALYLPPRERVALW